MGKLSAKDFQGAVFALVAPVKPHKVAWGIEQSTGLPWQRKAPVALLDAKGESVLTDYFGHESEHCQYRLIANRATSSSAGDSVFLVPSLRRFDYFLTIEDPEGLEDLEHWKIRLADNSQILFLQQIPIEKLKTAYAIIYT